MIGDEKTCTNHYKPGCKHEETTKHHGFCGIGGGGVEWEMSTKSQAVQQRERFWQENNTTPTPELPVFTVIDMRHVRCPDG